MSEVDDISQSLGKELRVLFSAALALAQIAAQRRAAQLREQAAATGVAEQEARRRFETEQRVAALGIALPEANMTPQQVAESWAKAEVARAHAPEVAEFWDQQARTVGVDPEEVRAQRWREHSSPREDPGAYRAAVAGLGAEVAAAVADADRAQAQQLEEAAEREHRAARADTRDARDADTEAAHAPADSLERQEATAGAVQAESGAQQHHDPADTLDARAADLDGDAARRERGAEVGDDDAGQSMPASPGVWQDGHPSARRAGKSYGVPPGRGTAPARRRSRGGGQGMAAAKQREHGLDR